MGKREGNEEENTCREVCFEWECPSKPIDAYLAVDMQKSDGKESEIDFVQQMSVQPNTFCSMDMEWRTALWDLWFLIV